MTVSAEEAAFQEAGVQHLQAIVDNNIAMAKETEGLDLPPSTIHKGVQAVLEGTHGAHVGRLRQLRRWRGRFMSRLRGGVLGAPDCAIWPPAGWALAGCMRHQQWSLHRFINLCRPGTTS